MLPAALTVKRVKRLGNPNIAQATLTEGKPGEPVQFRPGST